MQKIYFKKNIKGIPVDVFLFRKKNRNNLI